MTVHLPNSLKPPMPVTYPFHIAVFFNSVPISHRHLSLSRSASRQVRTWEIQECTCAYSYPSIWLPSIETPIVPENDICPFSAAVTNICSHPVTIKRNLL